MFIGVVFTYGNRVCIQCTHTHIHIYMHTSTHNHGPYLVLGIFHTSGAGKIRKGHPKVSRMCL